MLLVNAMLCSFIVYEQLLKFFFVDVAMAFYLSILNVSYWITKCM